MALVGTFKKIEDEHTNEMEDVIQIIPMDISKKDPNYSLRGQAITIQVPKVVKRTYEYDNAYVIVRSAALHQIVDNNENKQVYVNVLYSVYESKEAKNKGFFKPLYEGDVSSIAVDFDDERLNATNIIAYAYELIRTEQAFDNLIED